MRSGLSNKAVGQAGEFAVCAQLGKMGLIATPFAGNVPGFDVLVVDAHLNCVPLQVKTSQHGVSWITGDISKYAEITPDGPKILVGDVKEAPHPDLLRVYVALGRAGSPERYFILTEAEHYAIVADGFREWIAKYDGVRPHNPDSMRSAIFVAQLEPYENHWHRVTEQLEALERVRGIDRRA